jgi:hypothetical protein
MLYEVWRLLASTEITVYSENAGDTSLWTGEKQNTHFRTAITPAEVGTRYPVALQFDLCHGLHCRDLYSYEEVNSLDQRSDYHKALSYECHHKKNGQMFSHLSTLNPHVFVRT